MIAMCAVHCVVAVLTDELNVGDSAFAVVVLIFTAAGADVGITAMFRLPTIVAAEASSWSFSHMRPIVNDAADVPVARATKRNST